MNNNKLLNKAEKLLGSEAVNSILSAEVSSLESLIVNATREIEDAKAELQANPKYLEIKESLSALSAGLKELRKLNNVKIQLAATVLSDRGK